MGRADRWMAVGSECLPGHGEADRWMTVGSECLPGHGLGTVFLVRLFLFKMKAKPVAR